MTGIPASAVGSAPAAAAPAASAPSGGVDHFAELRAQPQFNSLRAIVQANPGALPQVLTQIGAANPALLARINAVRARTDTCECKFVFVPSRARACVRCGVVLWMCASLAGRQACCRAGCVELWPSRMRARASACVCVCVCVCVYVSV